MRIFISYRRADTAGHAGRLYDSLQTRFGRDNVFMDLSAIEAGQNFIDAIDAGIRSCDALVVLIGDEWLSSGRGERRLDDPNDFVRAEIAAALERNIPVIPVLVEGAVMPPAAVLPDSLKALATRQAHELSDRRWSYDVDRLVESLEKLGVKPPIWSRRTQLATAVVALVLVAAATVILRTSSTRTAVVDRRDVIVPDTAAATGNRPTPNTTEQPLVPTAILAGDWTAEVTYSWGAKHTERFSFEVDGDEVFGTASFLRVRRGITNGTLRGNSLQFETRTEEMIGDSTRNVTHRYRGKIAANSIDFFMTSEGASGSEPVEFRATRTTVN